MLLFELLNKPAAWKQRPDSRSQGVATKSFTFELDDGRLFDVHFMQNDMTQDDTKIWEASFKDAHDTRRRGAEFNPTGKGDELAIFSTVLQIITQFIQQHHNDIVMFSAEEMNRQTLYHRMLSRYVKPPMAFDMDNQEFYVGHQDLINELDL